MCNIDTEITFAPLYRNILITMVVLGFVVMFKRLFVSLLLGKKKVRYILIVYQLLPRSQFANDLFTVRYIRSYDGEINEESSIGCGDSYAC